VGVSPDPTDPERRTRFEALVGRVHDPLQRYARRRTDAATADEAVADALLVIWRRLDEVPAPAELPWCFGVARRGLANARRGDTRRLRLVGRLAAVTPRTPDATQPEVDPALDAALTRLRPDDREVLHLWAWARLEAAEIARVLDISPNAASIRLHRTAARCRGRRGDPARRRRRRPRRR